ncbi:MAG: mechanosensitive ion channel [Microthrixaceae bacterium]|nr:mechanosensitive ion channel [Microthrixaceae bacterium]MCB9386608.1 mechanosensitive ion channel [Microthrixaceae bacterium]MCO5320022.1 mechanosensitive ion channel [Microthrixaceae bacterium]
MTEYAWLWAAVAVGVGLLMGQIAGRVVRASIGRRSRSESTRSTALMVSRGVFWGCTAVGMVIAAGILDSEGLDEFVDLLREGLPRVFMGIVLAIVGYAVALFVAQAVGQSAKEATGVRQLAVERTLKVSIMAIAIVLGMVVAGIDTAVLLVILVALVGAPALALSLLTALGARGVASQISSGRALQHRFEQGWCLEVDGIEGEVIEMHPTFIELEDALGERHQLPNRWLLDRPYKAVPPGS